MALPSFATTDDLAVRLPVGVTVDDDRAEAALADASALIHAESAEAWVEDGELIEDVPGIALMVCCKAAIRAITNPSGAQQDTTGPFSITFGDVYLTSHERSLIRQAAGSTGGVWSLGTTRLDTDQRGDLIYGDTVYVEVNGQDEPMPLMPTNWP